MRGFILVRLRVFSEFFLSSIESRLDSFRLSPIHPRVSHPEDILLQDSDEAGDAFFFVGFDHFVDQAEFRGGGFVFELLDGHGFSLAKSWFRRRMSETAWDSSCLPSRAFRPLLPRRGFPVRGRELLRLAQARRKDI